MYTSWQELEENCMKCQRCGLCKTRNNLVFGVGNRNAKIMFIGEGPGENEDLQGEPFVGNSGKLLDKYLEVFDLNRHGNIYIANIVKCRLPHNREPNEEEMQACIFWLRNQVKLIKPKFIVCLGKVAATKIISSDFKVTKQHGEIVERNGTYLMGTYHPSALLRNPALKVSALEDMQKLREALASQGNM